MGKAALGEILRDVPVFRMNPLDMTGASEGFQSPDMRADIGLRVLALFGEALTDAGKVCARAVDAIGIGVLLDVEIDRAWLTDRRRDLDDHAALESIQLGGVWELDMMDAGVDPIEHEIGGLGQAVTGKSLAQHPAGEGLLRLLPVTDILAGPALFAEAVVLNRLVHGADHLVAGLDLDERGLRS